MLDCYVAKGMSCLIPHWFEHKLKSLPCLCNVSSLLFSIKDKQTIISHLEKSEKGTNLGLKFKISKQQISDIHKNKEKILMKFTDSVETSVGLKIWVLKASAAHLYHCRKISLPKG